MAVLNPGDTVTSIALPMGGHLTHGWKVNFSAKFFNSVQYGVDEKTNLINYQEVEKIVQQAKPKLMWGGATVYPRIFNGGKFSNRRFS